MHVHDFTINDLALIQPSYDHMRRHWVIDTEKYSTIGQFLLLDIAISSCSAVSTIVELQASVAVEKEGACDYR